MVRSLNNEDSRNIQLESSSVTSSFQRDSEKSSWRAKDQPYIGLTLLFGFLSPRQARVKEAGVRHYVKAELVVSFCCLCGQY